jgi:AraC-like DNA-binding protein
MGFLFDRRLLDMPLPSADPKLHEVMRRHAEVMLNDLPRTRSLSDQVRELIAKELTSGNASVVRVASHLNVSSRTLERRLEREGTTFTYLLDDLRKRLALGYVGADHLDLSEVALLLGFSQTSAFHRAFKRWTNQTPLHFRRAHRQAT